MAYTRKYFLQRILDVQKIVREKLDEPYTGKYQRNGRRTIVDIYRKDIKPIYRISYSTFYKWLSIPAAAELKKLENDN